MVRQKYENSSGTGNQKQSSTGTKRERSQSPVWVKNIEASIKDHGDISKRTELICQLSLWENTFKANPDAYPKEFQQKEREKIFKKLRAIDLESGLEDILPDVPSIVGGVQASNSSQATRTQTSDDTGGLEKLLNFNALD